MRLIHPLLLVGAVLATSAPPHQAHAKPAEKTAIDPKADALLRKMSTDLAAMKSFTVDTHQVLEVVTKEGEKIQGIADSTISLQRPNKLATDRMGPMGGARVSYDGANVTVYGKRENLYATAKAPDNIDAMFDFARQNLSIDAPGADLLYSNAYSILMEDVVSGRYMGIEPIGNRMCHHLAYRGNETDWQIWVEDGARALPCRFVITSKKEPGSPQYSVETTNWKEAKFPAETFAFKPPRDAVKIDFVTVSDEISKKKQQARR
ncbi:MAG: hypothetical protein H6Q90_7191 [Deltaproteobacteria bacterium]|nr:hypothetical protein [Deltaproteobacteria bacterium]